MDVQNDVPYPIGKTSFFALGNETKCPGGNTPKIRGVSRSHFLNYLFRIGMEKSVHPVG